MRRNVRDYPGLFSPNRTACILLTSKNQTFCTTAKFSALDIQYHNTQYLSSLQVLHSCRAVASGGASGALPGAPHFTFGPRLLHTSNTVFFKCGPSWFLAPPSGSFPPAAKSWRRACTRTSLLIRDVPGQRGGIN